MVEQAWDSYDYYQNCIFYIRSDILQVTLQEWINQ